MIRPVSTNTILFTFLLHISELTDDVYMIGTPRRLAGGVTPTSCSCLLVASRQLASCSSS